MALPLHVQESQLRFQAAREASRQPKDNFQRVREMERISGLHIQSREKESMADIFISSQGTLSVP